MGLSFIPTGSRVIPSLCWSPLKFISILLILSNESTVPVAHAEVTAKLSSASSPSSTQDSSSFPSSTKELVKLVSLDSYLENLSFDLLGSRIICLTQSVNKSELFISYDQGITYHHIHGLMANQTQKAIISAFYQHPNSSGHILLTDVTSNLIFVSSQAGQEFQKVAVQFKPSFLSYHPQRPEWIAGYNDEDGFLQIWISADGGFTWNTVLDNVKQFSWATSTLENVNQTLYVIKGSKNGSSTLFSLTLSKLPDGKLKSEPPTTLLSNVDKFILKDSFIFAVRKTAKFGAPTHQIDRELWVANAGENFRRVILPTLNRTCYDYHLISVTSDAIVIGAVHDDNKSSLLISDSHGTEFKSSLENVLYEPNKSAKRNPTIATQGIIKVYKIEGLDGMMIANQVKSPKEYKSVISFNYGSTWTALSKPRGPKGESLTCLHGCSFLLSNSSNSIQSTKYTSGLIFSRGLITSPGYESSETYYFSLDAGLTFLNSNLSGNYLVSSIDSGSLIVAIESYKSLKETSIVRYSLDYGSKWSSIPFLAANQSVSVYHLIPLDEGKSLSFTILARNSSSAQPAKSQWTSIRIDLSQIIDKPCTSDDYQIWSLRSPNSPCYLGQELTFQRKKSGLNCSSSSFKPITNTPVQSTSCNCAPSDYQCDFGFTRNATNSSICSPVDPDSEAPVEETCTLGLPYLKTKGYRRTFGNKCTQAIKNLEPEELTCRSKVNPSSNSQDKPWAASTKNKKQTGVGGIGTLLAFLVMTILCFTIVGLIVLYQGCQNDRSTQIVRSNYHVSPSDSNNYAIHVTFDNKTLRSDYEYSDDEPLVQA